MKKILFTLLLMTLNTISIFSQNLSLEFNKHYYECFEKWVVLDKEANALTYSYGFIYLDLEAGFTFHLEGKIKNVDGVLKIDNETEKLSLKVRLENNWQKVALLNESQLKMLSLPKTPEWLTFYKQNDGSVENLIIIGYHFNHIGQSLKAIEFLEKAYKMNPHKEKLEFELGFAYNATEQYNKAKDILELALKQDENNYMFYRELGYTYLHLNDGNGAEKTYKAGIQKSKSREQSSEMAVNMAYHYFQKRNIKKYEEWRKITLEYTEKGTRYYQYIEQFDEELKK